MNILERALAAAVKSVAEDFQGVVKEAEKKLTKFVEGVDETIKELEEIQNDGKTKRK